MQQDHLEEFMLKEHKWELDPKHRKFSFLFPSFTDLCRQLFADTVYLRNNLWVFFSGRSAC